MSVQATEQQMEMQPNLIYLNMAPRGSFGRPKHRVRYSELAISSVKGLTITQLVLGITIFAFHVAATIINSLVSETLHVVRLPTDFIDDYGTGIWVGLLTVISASIGVASYKQQNKSLIVTHLVLNVLFLVACPALLGTLSYNISSLTYCTNYGKTFGSSSGYHYYYYDYYDTDYYGSKYYRSTTTEEPLYLYGEKFSESSGTFYCRHGIFKTWLALDSAMLVCALVEFAITIALLIYNSTAACSCCRSSKDVAAEAGLTVSYHAQPRMATMQPSQMQAVPRLQVMQQVPGLAQGQPPVINYQYMQQPMVGVIPNAATPVALAAQPVTPVVPPQGAATNTVEGKPALAPEHARF